MELAERHGWVDVDGMLDSISERQFNEWRARERLKSNTRDRLEVIMAIGFKRLCAALGAKYEIDTFLPFMDKPSVEMSPDEMIAVARTITNRAGG
jgi:hypothetical protein